MEEKKEKLVSWWQRRVLSLGVKSSTHQRFGWDRLWLNTVPHSEMHQLHPLQKYFLMQDCKEVCWGKFGFSTSFNIEKGFGYLSKTHCAEFKETIVRCEWTWSPRGALHGKPVCNHQYSHIEKKALEKN